jgi:hypothetical protein
MRAAPATSVAATRPPRIAGRKNLRYVFTFRAPISSQPHNAHVRFLPDCLIRRTALTLSRLAIQNSESAIYDSCISSEKR